jgi:pimeloyl-ACP methyl ester carboxylesterase
LAASYLRRLQAPLKRLSWFESSAHFPFFEQPDRFREEMLRVGGAAEAYWTGHS